MFNVLKMCLPVSRCGPSAIDAHTRTKKERPARSSSPGSTAEGFYGRRPSMEMSPHCSQKPKAETTDVGGKQSFRPRSLNSFRITTVSDGLAHVDASKASGLDDDDGVSQSSTAVGSGMSTSDDSPSPKSSDTRQSTPFGLVHAELGDIDGVERDTPRLRLRRVDRQRLPKRGGLTQRELDALSVVAPETRTNLKPRSRQRA